MGFSDQRGGFLLPARHLCRLLWADSLYPARLGGAALSADGCLALQDPHFEKVVLFEQDRQSFFYLFRFNY